MSPREYEEWCEAIRTAQTGMERAKLARAHVFTQAQRAGLSARQISDIANLSPARAGQIIRGR